MRESFHVPFSSSLPPSSSLILLFLSVPFATDCGGGCGRDSFTPFLPLPFLSPFLLMGGGGGRYAPSMPHPDYATDSDYTSVHVA